MRGFIFRHTPHRLQAANTLQPVMEKCTNILRAITLRPKLTDRVALLFPQNEIHFHQFVSLAPQMGLAVHPMSPQVLFVMFADPAEKDRPRKVLTPGEIKTLQRAVIVSTGVQTSPNGYALLDEACNSDTLLQMSSVHKMSIVGLLDIIPGDHASPILSDGVGAWVVAAPDRRASLSDVLSMIIVAALDRTPARAVMWKAVSLRTLFSDSELRAFERYLGANVLIDADSVRKMVCMYFPPEGKELSWSDMGMYRTKTGTAPPASERAKSMGTARALVAFVETMCHEASRMENFVSYEVLGKTWPGYSGAVSNDFKNIFEARVPRQLRTHLHLGDEGIDFVDEVVIAAPTVSAVPAMKSVALKTPPPPPKVSQAPAPANKNAMGGQWSFGEDDEALDRELEHVPQHMQQRKPTTPERIFGILRTALGRVKGQASWADLQFSMAHHELEEIFTVLNTADGRKPTMQRALKYVQQHCPPDIKYNANVIWLVQKAPPHLAVEKALAAPATVLEDAEDKLLALLLRCLVTKQKNNKIKWTTVIRCFSPADMMQYQKLLAEYKKISPAHAERANSSLPLKTILLKAKPSNAKNALNSDGKLLWAGVGRGGPSQDKKKNPTVMQLNTSAFQDSVSKLEFLIKKMDAYAKIHPPPISLERLSKPTGPYCGPLVVPQYIPPKGAALHIRLHQKAICDLIEENDVTILRGDTGCGKSTQIPQYILNRLAEKNTPGRVIVTQPRRIAATSLAQRVATERGGGLTREVGYVVRYDNATNPSSALVFMTVGILLNIMERNPFLDGVTHVIIDEVHERAVDADLLLLILKRLMLGANRPSFKIILMSATVDIGKFEKYFREVGSVAIFDIPVERMFQISVLHLEDVLKVIPSHTPFSGEAGGRGGRDQRKWSKSKSDDDDDEGIAKADPVLPAYGDLVNKHKVETRVALAVDTYHKTPVEKVDTALIVKTIQYIVKTHKSVEGAILVFLPGVREIRGVRKVLEMGGGGTLGGGSGCHILELHGKLTNNEQRLVYEPGPPTLRKVVLATNIAETSLTIPDVVFVVDAGRANYATFSDHTQLSHLACNIISQSCARQRMGRAGRVRDGFAYRLYSSWDHKLRMAPFSTPEMCNLSTEELCLRVLYMGLGDAHSVLGLALDPPTPERIKMGIKVLKMLGAVADDGTTITPLGKRIAPMAMHPRHSKLVLMSEMFGMYQVGLNAASVLSTAAALFLRNVRGSQDMANQLRHIRHSFDGGAMSDVWTGGQIVDAFRRTPIYNRNSWCVDNLLVSKRLDDCLQLIAATVGVKVKDVCEIEGEVPLCPTPNVLARFQCVLCSALMIGVFSPSMSKVMLSTGDNVQASVDKDTVCEKQAVIDQASRQGFAVLVYSTAVSIHGKTKLENTSLVELAPLLLFGTNTFTNGDVIALAGTAMSIKVQPPEAAAALVRIRALLAQIVAFGCQYSFGNELVLEAGDIAAALALPGAPQSRWTTPTPQVPNEQNKKEESLATSSSSATFVENTDVDAVELFGSEDLDFKQSDELDF